MQIRKPIASLTAAAALFLGSAGAALAQSRVVIPSSSIPVLDGSDVSHTDIQLLVAPGQSSPVVAGNPAIPGAPGPPFTGYFFETPASIACVYQLVLPQVPGCNPNLAYMNPTGVGSRAIAIVDAFHDDMAATDLAFFSTQFGLPAPVFQQHYAQPGSSCSNTEGPTPPADPTGGWEVEESLDVQWAHAMAPGATILLVEAQNNSNANLLCAEQYAGFLLQAFGGGEVSNSWGGGEGSGELSRDSFFTAPNVVYFASSGDSPGVEYPCASPNVVCVGGTSVGRNANTGAFLGLESDWQDAGGGISRFEPRPSYQPFSVGVARGVPDISAVANPATGVWVRDTHVSPQGEGWFVVGGTSVASPLVAGIVNAAGNFASSSAAELSRIYGDPSSNFNDIVSGTCGLNIGFSSGVGWDFCTGRGSPRGYAGK